MVYDGHVANGVVVVDDGSTDKTAAEVERVAQKESRVRLFQQENHGKARALHELLPDRGQPLVTERPGKPVAQHVTETQVKRADAPRLTPSMRGWSSPSK